MSFITRFFERVPPDEHRRRQGKPQAANSDANLASKGEENENNEDDDSRQISIGGNNVDERKTVVSGQGDVDDVEASGRDREQVQEDNEENKEDSEDEENDDLSESVGVRQRGKISTQLLFRRALKRLNDGGKRRREEIPEDEDSIDAQLIRHTSKNEEFHVESGDFDSEVVEKKMTKEKDEGVNIQESDERRGEGRGVAKRDVKTSSNDLLDTTVDQNPSKKSEETIVMTPNKEPNLFKCNRKRLQGSGAGSASKRRRRRRSSNKVMASVMCTKRDECNYDSDVVDLEVLAAFDEHTFQSEQAIISQQKRNQRQKSAKEQIINTEVDEVVFGELIEKPLIAVAKSCTADSDCNNLSEAKSATSTDQSPLEKPNSVNSKKPRTNAFQLMMAKKKKRSCNSVANEAKLSPKDKTKNAKSEKRNGKEEDKVVRDDTEKDTGEVKSAVIDISQSDYDQTDSDEEVPRVLSRGGRRKSTMKKTEESLKTEQNSPNTAKGIKLQTASVKPKVAPIFNFGKTKAVSSLKQGKENSAAVKAFLNSEAPANMRKALSKTLTESSDTQPLELCFPSQSHFESKELHKSKLPLQNVEHMLKTKSIVTENGENIPNLILSLSTSIVEYFANHKSPKEKIKEEEAANMNCQLLSCLSPAQILLAFNKLSGKEGNLSLISSFLRVVERKVDSEAVENEAIMKERSLNEMVEGGSFLRQRRRRRASAGRLNEHKLLGLMRTDGQQKENDGYLGKPSSLLWTVKYAPASSEDVLGNTDAVTELSQWLSQWQTSKKEFTSQDDDEDDEEYNSFIDDDDTRMSCEDNNNAVLLTGPNGVGKTSVVYALAAEMGLRVLEVNASSTRSGKNVAQRLQEATQSHHVKRTKVNGQRPKAAASGALILFEDVDVVFEGDDDGFHSALAQIISESKRPVVMTTNLSSKYVPPLRFSPQRVRFFKPKESEIVEYLQLIALAEGFAVQVDALLSLIRANERNVGRSMLDLQCKLCSTLDNRRLSSFVSFAECQQDSDPNQCNEQESKLMRLLGVTKADIRSSSKNIPTIDNFSSITELVKCSKEDHATAQRMSASRTEETRKQDGEMNEEQLKTNKKFGKWNDLRKLVKTTEYKSLLNSRNDAKKGKSRILDEIRGTMFQSSSREFGQEENDYEIDFSPLSSEMVVVNGRCFNQDFLPMARAIARFEAARKERNTTTATPGGRRSRSNRFLHYFQSQDIFLTVQAECSLRHNCFSSY